MALLYTGFHESSKEQLPDLGLLACDGFDKNGYERNQ